MYGANFLGQIVIKLGGGMGEISNNGEYIKLFSKKYESKEELNNRLEKAFHTSLEMRNFEIDLYWRRANYFWIMNAALFAGYFILISEYFKSIGGSNEWGAVYLSYIVFFVSGISVVLSFSWYLVNRGSKYWQENWEAHVNALGEKVIGPIFTATISKDECKFCSIFSPYRYSVSRVNTIVSFFIFIIWFILFFLSGLFITTFDKCSAFNNFPVCVTLLDLDLLALIVIGSLIIFGSLIILWTCGKSNGDRAIKLYNSSFELKSNASSKNGHVANPD